MCIWYTNEYNFNDYGVLDINLQQKLFIKNILDLLLAPTEVTGVDLKYSSWK